MKKILLVEDDVDYAKILKNLLVQEQYMVDIVHTSANALKRTNNISYDLVIVDLHLGTLNGIQLMELLRRASPGIKIMILTGSTLDQDEVIALQDGANEYVRKTIAFAVLIQRIEKILHKSGENEYFSQQKFSSKFERIEMNPELREVIQDGELINLTQLEYDLLGYFLKNKNKPLSRANMFRDIWQLDVDVVSSDVRAIDTHVKNLRKKMNIKSIYTVRGIGYRWYEK